MRKKGFAPVILIVVVGVFIVVGLALWYLAAVQPKSKEACEAMGGSWGRVGLNPEEVCNLPTSDAGKICSGSSECEGSCIADLSSEDYQKAQHENLYTNGKCTRWKMTVGCLAFVEDGEVQNICVD